MSEFVKKIASLDNIRQWEERDTAIKETVSQHSFKVAAICSYLLNKIENKKGWEKNWGDFKLECLECALFHDFDESILGRDISHVVKYNSFNGESIRKSINDFVNYEMRRLNLDEVIKTNYREVVKKFVKLCDWLALLTFIVRNERLGAFGFSNEKKLCEDSLEEIIKSTEEEMLAEFHNFRPQTNFSYRDIFVSFIKKEIYDRP